MESSAHILVVDDHREIRDLLARYLARCGFRVSAVEKGEGLPGPGDGARWISSCWTS